MPASPNNPEFSRIRHDLRTPVTPLNTIHVSAATATLLGEAFPLTPRGLILIKGIGKLETWTLRECAAS